MIWVLLQSESPWQRNDAITFLSYFEKIAHMSVVWAYVSLWLCIFVTLYLCIFVTLYVRMFVARANKVEGTISWCLGTNEI